MENLILQPDPQKLMKARKELGLSRQALAIETHLTAKMVENIEQGLSEPFGWQIIMWARACEKASEDLCTWAEPGKFLQRKFRQCRKNA